MSVGEGSARQCCSDLCHNHCYEVRPVSTRLEDRRNARRDLATVTFDQRREHADAVWCLPLAQIVNLFLFKSSILSASASGPAASPFFHQEEMSSISS